MRDSIGSPTRIRDILPAKGSDVKHREVGASHGWLFVRTMLADALMALLESRGNLALRRRQLHLPLQTERAGDKWRAPGGGKSLKPLAPPWRLLPSGCGRCRSHHRCATCDVHTSSKTIAARRRSSSMADAGRAAGSFARHSRMSVSRALGISNSERALGGPGVSVTCDIAMATGVSPRIRAAR